MPKTKSTTAEAPKEEATLATVTAPAPVGGSIDIEALHKFMNDTADAKIGSLHHDGVVAQLAFLPDGEGSRRIVSLKPFIDEFRKAPERREGTARLETLASFIDHAKRFKAPNSAIFATENGGSPVLTSVFDYHEEGATGIPRFRKHKGVYSFPISDEWAAWSKQDGTFMTQAEFATFLEDRIMDVAEVPEKLDGALAEIVAKLEGRLAGPSRLLELSRGLAVNVNSTIKGAVNLASGEATMQFVEQHTDAAGAPLKVPSLFCITVPIFRAGTPYRIVARLRYRIRDGRAAWAYSLYQPERAFLDAYEGAAKEAAAKTDMPLFFGTAE